MKAYFRAVRGLISVLMDEIQMQLAFAGAKKSLFQPPYWRKKGGGGIIDFPF